MLVLTFTILPFGVLVLLLADPRRHQTAPTPRQDRPLKKYRLFIKNVVFSLEKCRFRAHRGVLHYVLRRKNVIFRNNDHFELEICVKARGGRAARCMGTLLAGPRRHQTTPRPRQDRPLKKYHFLIKNIDFSLEKCRFGAHRGVLHYVLKRERALP